jgi:hypothetical protein
MRRFDAHSRNRTPGPPLLPRSMNLTPASSSICKTRLFAHLVYFLHVAVPTHSHKGAPAEPF